MAKTVRIEIPEAQFKRLLLWADEHYLDAKKPYPEIDEIIEILYQKARKLAAHEYFERYKVADTREDGEAALREYIEHVRGVSVNRDW